ncbi:MOSC domain-containing protein [Streptomyces chumphonensis]|uniref:MOSC domain-containing protein n=1 Tax=Streptomyces chumphonensis TaxID=1214925 RepID=A0A927IBH4_9ACTN|nr:MOSC N-terminal beta barrel domain-containing protein [Streptomyces chumphonensis]MBD3931022.1 MOSC domain-containing protein [Streptomyces chumphonensis]
MPTPILTALHVYPVKSLAGTTRREAEVEPWGLAGDRRWMVVREGRQLTQRDAPRLALVVALERAEGGVSLDAPGMPRLTVDAPGPAGAALDVTVFGSPVRAGSAGARADAWLSRYIGTPVRLVRMTAPERDRSVDPRFGRPQDTVSFADGYPLLLTAESSLEALNSLIAEGDHADEGPLPMNRFRPNLVVGGTAPWAEDGWRRLRVGEVEFEVVRPSGRCVVTTTDQATGGRGKEPLRTLALHRRSGDRLIFGQNLVPRTAGTVRRGDELRVLG